MEKPVFLPKWFMAALKDESFRGANGADGVSVDKVELNDNKLFVHFSNGSVHEAGTIDVLQGERGERGERGESGNDGRDGVDGRDGLPGTNGAHGFDGKDGEKGDRGERGERGEVGLQGAVGERGPKGEKGEKGDQGPIPKHQIDAQAGRVRFERPDGTWGAWVEIKQEIKTEVRRGSGGGGARLTQAVEDIKGLKRNANAAIYSTGTGLLDITLPGLAKLTNTTARVYAGSGYFADLTDPINPTLTYTTWTQQDFTDSYVSTNLRTWIAIDSSGTVAQFADEITSAERRDYIQIGVLTHIDGATITNVNLLPVAIHDNGGKLTDICQAIGFVNLEGNVYSGASTTANTLKKTAGKSFACDRNYSNDKLDANVTQQAAVDPITSFFYAYRDGSGGETISIETTLDTTKYDDGTGTLATMTDGYWATHRIYVSTTSGSTIVSVTQEQHKGKIEALSRIDSEAYDPAPGAQQLLLRGYITFKKGATGFKSNNDVIFTPADKWGQHTENRPTNGIDLSMPVFKDYPFSTNGIGAGTYYAGGFYDAPATDANLTQASTSVTYGVANVAYAAHPFIVAGGAGTVDTGQVGLRCVFDKIEDDGTRTDTVTEVITTDITTLSLNDYHEVDKALGTYTLELYVVSGSPTAYSLDFNYGYAKYEDFGNRDFMVTDFEVTGLAGATDSGADFALLRHGSTGWTYHATAFSPGNGDICRMTTDHGAGSVLSNGVDFAYKRAELDAYVQASGPNGLLVEIVVTQNNSVRIGSLHIGVVL